MDYFLILKALVTSAEEEEQAKKKARLAGESSSEPKSLSIPSLLLGHKPSSSGSGEMRDPSCVVILSIGCVNEEKE